MDGASTSATGPLPGQLSSPLVPLAARSGRHGRCRRSANAVGGKRDHPHAVEVGDCARDTKWRRAPDFGLCVERRNTAEIGGSADRQWAVAEGGARSPEYQIFLEAVHLPMGRRHAGRTHAGLTRYRRQRYGATVGSRSDQKENLPRRQRAVPAQSHNLLISAITYSSILQKN